MVDVFSVHDPVINSIERQHFSSGRCESKILEVILKKKAKFTLPLEYIQNIRFALALAEVNPEISIPYKDKYIFDYLYEKFKIPVKSYHERETRLKELPISFSHQKPEIRVEHICMPLVFPLVMVNFCEKNHTNINRKFVFSGLKTDKRKRCLENWLANVYGSKVEIKEYFAAKEVDIRFSSNGRKFPIKAWDQEYYDELLTNQFILCPDGDFIWTYRFFEAIMCGAIPVIENICDRYTNFKYYDMKTPLEEMVYDKGMVKHNFEYFKDNYTLLNKQLYDPDKI